MKERIKQIVELYRVNTRLFINSLDGVDDRAAAVRPNDSTNSMIFIAGHLLGERYWIVKHLGIKLEFPFSEEFDKAVVIDDIKEFPLLADVLKYWDEISAVLEETIAGAGEEVLLKKSPVEIPFGDNTTMGFISFLVVHEAMHVGQLGILRKYNGFEAVKFS